MTGRRAIVGLCMLCALLVSAFAAQSASAVTKGTTAFTCQPEVGGAFLGEHCLTSAQGGSGAASGHVPIAANTTTELIGTNSNTASGTTAADPSILKATIAGTPLELKATTISGTGWLTNATTETGEHYVHGEGVITYTGVEVVKPAGKNCKIFTDNNKAKGEEGVVHTVQLKATTQGQGDFVKFEPAAGAAFATFIVECNAEVPEALQGTYEVTGSIKCPTKGATILCNHEEITTENKLKTKGAKAGIQGSLTLKGRAVGGSTYSPITSTTVETP